MSKPKVMSLFSGCGGTCLAFKNAGYEIAVANEIDKHAITTYKENFDNKLIEGCIKENIEELKSYKDIDIIVAGFPCQSFSIAGKRKGMEDDRGRLIDSVFEIIDSVQPKCVMLENVRGLISSNEGKDFKYILDSLNSLGYIVSYKIINAFKAGYTRQMRNRVYIVASKNSHIILPEFKSDKEMIDFDFNVDIPELEYTKEKYPKCFAGGRDLTIIETGKFYQIRVAKKIREINNCPTLLANMGVGGHAVPIVRTTSGKIRKFSVRECFDLMGFPENFKMNLCSKNKLYKQAGNSVIVPLVCDIAKYLKLYLVLGLTN